MRRAEPRDDDVAERRDLVEVDEALLAQLEHGEEADDDLEPLVDAVGELAEGRCARASGSSSSSASTASATLARIGATWSRSTRGTGFGADGA